jgi:hypothetical protein
LVSSVLKNPGPKVVTPKFSKNKWQTNQNTTWYCHPKMETRFKGTAFWDVTPCSLVWKFIVSGEYTASIFRLEE